MMDKSTRVCLSFEKTGEESGSCIAWLTLNRPEMANAFDADMIRQLRECFVQLQGYDSCRALVIRGAGKHFCGGADLEWMKASAQLTQEENLEEARGLSAMFAALHKLPFPTIAVVHGAVYGGGVGLVACCDLAIADIDSRFCLSEVRLGILPAVIYPYLSLKMRYGSLLRLSMTGRLFLASEARDTGLIELCCEKNSLETTLQDEIRGVLSAGPAALTRLKFLQHTIFACSDDCHALACRLIAEARSGPEAQAGFQAFFKKQSPPWVVGPGRIPEES
ncbi:MAG: enoyl-CoA hydratase/isomerase family protein [Deltaproteobacteria bacterium]|nr:enoyl-CoA hydratase/isomerase family protein [Deltaproteobacteria bacterium]